jgi:hypothetical protein
MHDDFDNRTKEILARRVGFLCSNPACQKPTSGPQLNPDKALSIGVAAHITAASFGGPRYDQFLTNEERSSMSNGIWLCQNCARLIDSDDIRYTVELLHNWKDSAELRALSKIEDSHFKTDSQSKRDFWNVVQLNLAKSFGIHPSYVQIQNWQHEGVTHYRLFLHTIVVVAVQTKPSAFSEMWAGKRLPNENVGQVIFKQL